MKNPFFSLRPPFFAPRPAFLLSRAQSAAFIIDCKSNWPSPLTTCVCILPPYTTGQFEEDRVNRGECVGTGSSSSRQDCQMSIRLLYYVIILSLHAKDNLKHQEMSFLNNSLYYLIGIVTAASLSHSGPLWQTIIKERGSLRGKVEAERASLLSPLSPPFFLKVLKRDLSIGIYTSSTSRAMAGGSPSIPVLRCSRG